MRAFLEAGQAMSMRFYRFIVFRRRMLILRVLVAVVFFWQMAGFVSALELGIPNPSFRPGKKVVRNTPALPLKWKLAAGKREDCIKWVGRDARGKDLAHVAISRGVTLSTRFDVPVLTERERKVKGSWLGVFSFDTLGAATAAGGSEGAWRAGVYVLDGGRERKVASLAGGARVAVEPRNPVVKRKWKVISEKAMAGMAGKTIEVRVMVPGITPVVIAGVSLSRLHSKPSGKLFGRANGGTGPDLLGAGSLGFDAMTEHRQNILTIVKVYEGGAADKAGLKVGDMIVGVNKAPLPLNDLRPGWAWFHSSHEAVLGRAVVDAWSDAPPVGRGVVRLVVLRKGKVEVLRCQLGQRMDFEMILESKAREMLHEQTVEYLVKNQCSDGSWRGPIRTTFAALALLATEDPVHAPRVKKAVDWMLNSYPEAENFGGLGFWHSSYAGILYCEYYLATGDGRVLPRVSAILDWILSGTHTSKWGMACLGHGVGGLPYGQKALVAPACHALVLDALAERCGVKSGLWQTLLPYMEHSWSNPAKGGHGSLGYNASYKDKREFWSRSGLFAMAAHLRGERPDMEKAIIGFMRARHPWLRNSHAYGEPGGALGLLALNLCDPDVFKEVFNAYGWWFALAWEPGYGLKFTTPHMGAPYMGRDDLMNAIYALVLASPRQSLWITGGQKRNWFDVSKLATPLSKVMIRRDRNGRVTLACRVPGPTIRYTLDGTGPGEGSRVYEGPVELVAGGMIKARAFDSTGRSGEVVTAIYGPSKSGWKVLDASGHQDPAEARRRAGYAIDHSRTHSWLTDVGQDAKGYPHYIVFDLGGVVDLRAVTFDFVRDAGAASRCTLKASRSVVESPVTLAQERWSGYQSVRRIAPAKPTKARFIRLEFDDPVKEGAISLAIREIDIEVAKEVENP